MSEKTAKIVEASHVDVLRRRVDDLSTLIQVTALINSSLDLDRVVALVMEKAQAVMRAEASSVMLINDKENRLECKVALGRVSEQIQDTIHLEKGQGLAGWVWEHRTPLIVEDASRDKRFYASVDQQTGFQTRSVLTIPLFVQDRVIGVAQVINRKDGEPFNQEDLELFSTFCNHVALAIDNARMHQIALEQSRLQQELEHARVIQQSFMPQQLPETRDKRFQVRAFNLPAVSVGGDFFDAVHLDSRRLGLLIGDVSGKGIPAALLMARVMSDFRFFAQQFRKPGRILSKLNDNLVPESQRGMFVTLMYGVVDLERGRIDLSDGGHLPILLFSQDQDEPRWVRPKGGIPLGIEHDSVYHSQSFTLSRGDTLIFFTDGLVEAKNTRQKQFSFNRLASVIQHSADGVDRVLDTILTSVQEFSKGVTQHDDITALVFRWNGK